MGTVNISRKMLKNPPIEKKTKNSVQKCPHVKNTKRKIVQKKSQLVALKKQLHKPNSKPTNASQRDNK
jgi:hypothetical protein